MTWTVAVSVPPDAALLFQLALERHCAAVAAAESERGRAWRVTGYCDAVPDRAAIELALAVAAAGAGIAAPPAAFAKLAERDWLAENHRAFPPVSVARYRILRPHHRAPASFDGHVPIRLEASLAFGSGTHPSTQNCLLVLDDLARRRAPRLILDLGSGSGILAIAAAKTWPARIIATDVDAVATALTRHNAALNGVAHRVTSVTGPGFAGVPRRHRRFDLIVANILAGTLGTLAPSVAQRLAPGGAAVLSGLLRRDESEIVAIYRAQGLVLRSRIAHGEWLTVELERPAAKPRTKPAKPRSRPFSRLGGMAHFAA